MRPGRFKTTLVYRDCGDFFPGPLSWMEKEIKGRNQSRHEGLRRNEMSEIGFQKELETLLNRHSQDASCDTHDFVLAQYLSDCLRAYRLALQWRGAMKWDLKHADKDSAKSNTSSGEKS